MLTVTGSESADEAGGFDPVTSCAVAALTWVPCPSGQAPWTVWAGLQTKKVMVPVGVPPSAWAAVTTAWSVTDDPKGVVFPEPTDGVVTVVVGICATVKHSLVPLSPPNSVSVPG